MSDVSATSALEYFKQTGRILPGHEGTIAAFVAENNV